MSAISLAVLVEQQAGIETVLHYACRDRTLLGMESDLLGAHAMGIRNLLLITGDPPRRGDYSLAIQAEHILPELSVSQVLIYHLGETETAIDAELELDIREAPLREFNLRVPADFTLSRVNVAQRLTCLRASVLAILNHQDAIHGPVADTPIQKSVWCSRFRHSTLSSLLNTSRAGVSRV